MEKIYDLTINDFLEAGVTDVHIYFHRCGDLQTAYNKLKPFTRLGSIEKASRDGSVWLYIETEEVEITAFL